MSERGLPTIEVADRAGTTFRQLDYWARLGCITPSIDDAAGSGSNRRWSERDAAAITAIVTVARDFASMQPVASMPSELVARIWDAWHIGSDATIVIEVGTITITLHRGE